jgi:hypothetical protein
MRRATPSFYEISMSDEKVFGAGLSSNNFAIAQGDD